MQDKLRDIYVLTLFLALAGGRGMPVEMRMRVYKKNYMQCHVVFLFLLCGLCARCSMAVRTTCCV